MKRLWSQLSPMGRVALLAGLVTTAAILIITARHDLAHRNRASIRGNPEAWDRVTRFPGGATAYLIAGRRTA